MPTPDSTVYDSDPDAIVLRTIEEYVSGHATREDVETAIKLALEFPAEAWRTEIRYRYIAMVAWTAKPELLNGVLERALSYRTTVKGPGGVQ